MQNTVTSHSDRCVFFTKTAAERHDAFLERKHNARKALLETLASMNAELVHPRNPNYWSADKGEDALIGWARNLELLSKQDMRVLRGF